MPCVLQLLMTSVIFHAQECEAGMHDKFGAVTKEYRARFRALMFNLQDTKVRLRRQELPLYGLTRANLLALAEP